MCVCICVCVCMMLTWEEKKLCPGRIYLGYLSLLLIHIKGLFGTSQWVKNSAPLVQCKSRRHRLPPWVGKMAAHSIFAWRIPWTEETGGLQSVGSKRVPRKR